MTFQDNITSGVRPFAALGPTGFSHCGHFSFTVSFYPMQNYGESTEKSVPALDNIMVSGPKVSWGAYTAGVRQEFCLHNYVY